MEETVWRGWRVDDKATLFRFLATPAMQTAPEPGARAPGANSDRRRRHRRILKHELPKDLWGRTAHTNSQNRRGFARI
jgi:hypothetical protein